MLKILIKTIFNISTKCLSCNRRRMRIIVIVIIVIVIIEILNWNWFEYIWKRDEKKNDEVNVMIRSQK